MRRATPLALALLLALSASPAAPGPAAATAPEGRTGPGSATGRYIVVLEDGADVDVAKGRAGTHGIRVDRTYRHALKGYTARLDGAQLTLLEADPDVALIVEDEVISMMAQSVPTGVRRVNGKESLVADIDGAGPQVDADVAIVDTGIGGRTSRAHEDLNIAGGVNCYDGDPDDGKAPDPQAWGDVNGHGTHVAGTVGALDNNLGVVGVATGVRLWAVRILDSAGNGFVSGYVCGLDWIAKQVDPDDESRPLIEAVNMSVARSGSDDGNCGNTEKDVMHRAICRVVDAGITVVAAAGNDSFNAANLRPASYDEVITVSALADTDGRPGGLGGSLCYSWGSYDRDDTFADFSNYGRDVDLIAPGKCIWSTLPGNAYGYISGTSMAAPHVTGAAALYKASRPLASNAQVRAALRAAGTLDWATATDPDAIHEPLLDVSHIVALGDWTIDATPGASRGALLSGAGGTLDLPLQVVRAEDVAGAIDLDIQADSPLAASLADARLEGLDATATAMRVTVPPGLPSGIYQLTVTATDGVRERVSRFSVTVDSDRPTMNPPALAFRRGGVLDDGVLAAGTWSGASDPGGTIARYEVRWRVDGDLKSATTVSSTTREVLRRLRPGHTYALQVRARDAAGNWSHWSEGARVTPTLTQDTSRSLVAKGRWSRARVSWASGGTVMYSTDKGARVRRTFTGRAIAWVASESAGRGRAAVYIDGAHVATVDLRRSTTRHRSIVFTRSWASPGPHTLRIVVLGTSRRPRVDVDAFVVVP